MPETKYEPDARTAAQIANNFTYHPPVNDQPARYVKLRIAALEFATLLATNCPPSRELSLALTKLEEVSFWSNASIARNEGDATVHPAA